MIITVTIAAWAQAIERCEIGYDDCLDEYRSDLQVRDALEHALQDGPLRQCQQLGWVREQVAALDLRFRALLQEDVIVPGPPGPWWHRHPLRYAGAETAAEYALLGIQVEVRGS